MVVPYPSPSLIERIFKKLVCDLQGGPVWSHIYLLSVGLMFAILGPASGHGWYHDAVHIEPSLAQWCCVSRTQAGLKHIEQGLSNHLRNMWKNPVNQSMVWKITVTLPEDHCQSHCHLWRLSVTDVISVIITKPCRQSVLTVKDWVFTPTVWCFLPRFNKKSSNVCRSSRWLTAASITNITWTNTQSVLSWVYMAVNSEVGSIERIIIA